MKTWNSGEARTRFDEILSFCAKEPQIICQGKEPAGVIIDIAFFNELMTLWKQKPTISDLLDELGEIKKHEPADIEIPERKDRPF